ncbi:UDP-N-acetyl-D-glucosamine 6-dehydrogenase [compost metagenome]
MDTLSTENIKIAIVGLGYVGLPLAVEFGKKFTTVGFDIDQLRIDELSKGFDKTLETQYVDINSIEKLSFTSNLNDLKDCTVYIVTVPTPVDEFKNPDLRPLLKASEMLGTLIKKGDIVIYESTVYPGCTEEDCVPVLEKYSGLTFNKDFFCGYSPERINPGDKTNTLKSIRKVVSGSTPEIAKIIKDLYDSIIEAGTFLAPSLKVAEASKAIENAQRDVNISFVNELALIFDRMGIDTNDVLEAAGTKWNFLKFRPGLVGGHCIGVDPYYLTHKAQSLGYYPQVILSGRRINDNMGMFIANKVVKLLIQKKHRVDGAKALILGVTFKENCPDVRNSRVIDIYEELTQFGLLVDIYDPWADKSIVKKEYGIDLSHNLYSKVYDAIILAVAHNEFLEIDFSRITANGSTVIFDTKGILDRNIVDARL